VIPFLVRDQHELDLYGDSSL